MIAKDVIFFLRKKWIGVETTHDLKSEMSLRIGICTDIGHIFLNKL